MPFDDAADALSRRFAASIADELGRGVARDPGEWPALEVPPALHGSIVEAARLEGSLPAPLVDFYADRAPRQLVDQFFRVGDLRELLWEPLELARMPRLSTALDGLVASLSGAGIEPSSVLGTALPTTTTSIAGLYRRTLFGRGLPFLGLLPAEREVVARELSDGAELHELLDRRISGNLVHELCHGPPARWSGPVPPWHLSESAAIHLGSRAFPRHVFPDVAGEAVPGVSLFVLLADGLVRLFGERALWSLLTGVDTRTAFGPLAAGVFDVASWQDWRRHRVPPFARDARDAVSWIKLADACRGVSPLSDVVWRTSAVDALDVDALAALPSLVAEAEQTPWNTLPWWSEEPTEADIALVPRAVDALFQVNRMDPIFATVPSEPPDGLLVLDVGSCLLRALPRRDGVFAEPARWLIPPPLCRRLHERGARIVRFEDVARRTRSRCAEALLELTSGPGALSSESVVPIG